MDISTVISFLALFEVFCRLDAASILKRKKKKTGPMNRPVLFLDVISLTHAVTISKMITA